MMCGREGQLESSGVALLLLLLLVVAGTSDCDAVAWHVPSSVDAHSSASAFSFAAASSATTMFDDDVRDNIITSMTVSSKKERTIFMVVMLDALLLW